VIVTNNVCIHIGATGIATRHVAELNGRQTQTGYRRVTWWPLAEEACRTPGEMVMSAGPVRKPRLP
jgi:hypothetical protein